MKYMHLRKETQSLHRIHLYLRSKEYKGQSNPSPITHFPIDYTLKPNFRLKVKKQGNAAGFERSFFSLLQCIPCCWGLGNDCSISNFFLSQAPPSPESPVSRPLGEQFHNTGHWRALSATGSHSEFSASEEVALGWLLRAEPCWVQPREPKSTSVKQPCSRPQSDPRPASAATSLSRTWTHRRLLPPSSHWKARMILG